MLPEPADLRRYRRAPTGPDPVARMVSALEGADGCEEVAAAVCTELARLPGTELVEIVAAGPQGTWTGIARDGAPDLVYGQLSLGRLWRQLGDLDAHAEATPRRLKVVPVADGAAAGLRSIAAYALGNGPHPAGMLLVGSRHPSGRLALQEATLVQAGAITGLVIGPQLAERQRLQGLRQEIRQVARGTGISSVFQPIRRLATRELVGLEALTRFQDGRPPDQRFTEAQLVGLGVRLEEACIRRALAQASRLPEGIWLSINVSPQMIQAMARMPGLARSAGRPLVLEMTEHVSVAEYGPIRQALGRLGPDVRLAVDDVGAGYATLRHILELRPSFVKLDIRFVAGIDGDPTRQAFITALRQAAEATGAELVAEGIEREAELRTLVDLAVPLGQGYLLGRPAPALDQVRTGSQ
jgi:EAL domain-containing protein (putative c-di-GMP-specific phosphodiesterase class I)